MAKNFTTSFTGFKERECTMSIVLDTRSNRSKMTEYPVAARFTIDRRSYYYHIGGSYSKQDFSDICNSQKSKSSKYEEKRRWLTIIDKHKNMVINLCRNQKLTMEKIKVALEGKTQDTSISFVGIWEDMIERMKTDNNGARYTTAESYECALKSFKKIMWRTPIEGFKIGIDELKTWDNGMKMGIKGPNGKIIGKISDTTRGIYLRTARAVWNECISLGYFSDCEYPFSNVKKTTISIPTGATRKDEYLDVERMTRLYRVFINKEYPQSWSSDYIKRSHFSLGLFLVQYLCNGFNLADAGQLRYTQYYFDTERKAFKFNRKKTRGRSEGGSEVIIPITEPLQNILDEIAAEPVLDAYVFPSILKGTNSEVEIRKYVSQENSNVQDRLIKICKSILNWEVRPSGTWARHSFATNLTHAGVDKGYITESMGHSHSESVTDRYIANYPLEKQMEYNSKLLNLSPASTVKKKDIKKMSKAEMAALLMDLLNE